MSKTYLKILALAVALVLGARQTALALPPMQAAQAAHRPFVRVSCDNRGRLWEAAPFTAKTTLAYYYNRTLHRTFADCDGLQAYYWNGYITGSTPNLVETAGVGAAALKISFLTHLVGTSNIVAGGSGPPTNQTGAIATKATFCQLESAVGAPSDIDPIHDMFWHLQSYATFVAAGGSVSSDCRTVIIPPGYTVTNDPGPNVKAGDYYYIQSEQTVQPNVPYHAFAGSMIWSGNRYDGTGTNSTGDYNKPTGATQSPIVDDVNWGSSSYNPVSAGPSYGWAPAFVLGKNYKGARTVVVDGTSITQGSYDFGDADGTSGTLSRALSLGGHPFIDTACASCTMVAIRNSIDAATPTTGGYLRLGLLQYATGGVISGHCNNDGCSMPSEGAFTAAAPNDTSTASNTLALLRWWIWRMRNAMPAGVPVLHPTQYPGSTSFIDYIVPTSVTSDTTDSILTVTLPAGNVTTAALSVGEYIIVTGSTTTGCNTQTSTTPAAGQVLSIIDATHFTYQGSSTPSVSACAGTIHITDSFQSYAFQTPAYGPGGIFDVFDDYLMHRNGWLNSNGYTRYDPDVIPGGVIGVDETAAIGFLTGSTGGNYYLWPPCSGIKSATPDGGHTAYCSAARAAPVEAPQYTRGLGVYGYVH